MRREEIAESLYQAYRSHRRSNDRTSTTGQLPIWNHLDEHRRGRFLAMADRILWLFTSGQLGTEEE